METILSETEMDRDDEASTNTKGMSKEQAESKPTTGLPRLSLLGLPEGQIRKTLTLDE